MKKTVLFEEHQKLGAKMVDFAGWMMPIQYQSVKEEIIAVRNSAGIFDVSHMGEFLVEGSDASNFVDHVMTNDFLNLPEEKAIYSPLCNENAMILDDLIAYKINSNKILICVNASNIEKDWKWLYEQKKSFKCTMQNLSDQYSLIALQGPKSFALINQINGDLIVQDKDYYSVQEITFKGHHLWIARTGYTGEDGFEIFMPNSIASEIWTRLIALKAHPAGLGARDTLRMEVCFPLYGHELNEELTPLDCGLKWTIKMNKKNFIGKAALESYQQRFQLIKFSLEKGIPRQGYNIENEKAEILGQVCSGTLSPHLDMGIGLGLVDKKLFNQNEAFFIDIRGKKYHANYHSKPFMTGGHK